MTWATPRPFARVTMAEVRDFRDMRRGRKSDGLDPLSDCGVPTMRLVSVPLESYVIERHAVDGCNCDVCALIRVKAGPPWPK